MFDFLNDLTKDDKGSKGGFDRKTVTSNHAGLETVENGGSALIEEAELEEAPKTKDDNTVQLSQFKGDKKISERSESAPSTLNISSKQAANTSLLTDEEKRSIEDMEDRLSDEELESREKVQEALNDPSMPNTLSGLWLSAAKNENKFGMGEIDEYSSKEEAIKSQLKNRDWVEDSDPKVKDMNASDFADLIANAQSEKEELEESSSVEFERITEEDNTDIEISELDDETVEELTDSWQNKSHVFAEMARDIEKSQEIPDTNIETVSDGIKRITTSFDELKADLWQLHNDDSKQTQIIDKSGDTIVAKAHTGERV